MLFMQAKDKTSAFNYIKSLCGRSAGQVTDKKKGFAGDIEKLCHSIKEIITGFDRQEQPKEEEEVKQSFT